jgi:hypothetical protein
MNWPFYEAQLSDRAEQVSTICRTCRELGHDAEHCIVNTRARLLQAEAELFLLREKFGKLWWWAFKLWFGLNLLLVLSVKLWERIFG